MKRAYYFLLLFFLNASAFAQNDSLLAIWSNSAESDSSRLKAVHTVAWKSVFKNLDTAIVLAKEELSFAKEKNILKYQAGAYNTMGVYYFFKGDFPKSLENYLESARLRAQEKDTSSLATTYNNIGILYKEKGDYDMAMEYYRKSLDLHLSSSVKNKPGIAMLYSNIGVVHKHLKEYEKALEYYRKTLEMYDKMAGNNKKGISNVYGNMGVVYKKLGQYEKALEYYKKDLALKRELDDTKGVGRVYSNLGNLNLVQNNYKKARDWCLMSYDIFQKLQTIPDLENSCGCLYNAYKGLDQYKKALYFHEEFVMYKDSILNEKRIEQITKKEEQFKYRQLAAADSIKNLELKRIQDAKIEAQEAKLKEEEAKLKEEEAKNERNQVIKITLSIIALMAIIFTAFLFNRFKIIKRQKKTIEDQKVIVEEKQKEVLDSIYYAKQIQEALLNEDQVLSRERLEHFVLYKPKDIVSGDFFWSLEKQKHLYLTVADCTGHGVPGAFLTLLGTAYLNEINAKSTLYSPGEILDKLREKIIFELNQKQQEGVPKDGMDMSLIRINIETNEVEWAGANNGLWIIRRKERAAEIEEVKGAISSLSPDRSNILYDFKPDKQPIGYTVQKSPFTNHRFKLFEGDSIYLFTDGFADQFGGQKGKKFKQKPFKDFVLSIQDSSMSEQKEMIARKFETWRGDLEQIDDVCVIGIKI